MVRGPDEIKEIRNLHLTKNKAIIDFLENFPLSELDYETDLQLKNAKVSPSDFHTTSLKNLYNMCNFSHFTNNLTKDRLPVFSSTSFKAGRINHAKANWFELLSLLDFDPRIETLQEILRSELNLQRFFAPRFDQEIQVSDKTIKWVKCDDNKPVPLLKVENDWKPCHDFSIRNKQVLYQKELDAIILELVNCNIVHVCGHVDKVDPSYFRIISPLHLVIERRTDAKTGTFTTRLRATIDNKVFNQAFVPPSFYLLTGYEVQKTLRDFESASSWDLRKSFYNSTPTPDLQGYTGFRWRNFLCFYSCSAFGLSISPYLNFLTTEFSLQIYFKLLRKSPFLKQSLSCLSTVYVDDFLLTNPFKNSRNKILPHDKVFIQLMATLGFTVNAIKSDPCASKQFKFLGLNFSLDRKRNQLFASPTEQQLENLKLNLAQLITAGNFQGLNKLEDSEFLRQKANKARFFSSKLNHNLLEKVNGSVLWIQNFHEFNAQTFLIRKTAYYPYMLQCKNIQNAVKIQLWNFFFQTNFLKIVNPSKFEKSFEVFHERQELLDFITKLPDKTGPSFIQLNVSLFDDTLQFDIMSWSKKDTEFFVNLSQAVLQKRTFYRAVNFSVETPEEPLESLTNFDLKIGATNLIFDQTNILTKRMRFLFSSKYHNFDRIPTLSRFSRESISDRNLKAAWLKDVENDSLVIVNSIPVGQSIANLQSKFPRKSLTFYTDNKNLRQFCREVARTNTFYQFKIPSDLLITNFEPKFPSAMVIFCQPK